MTAKARVVALSAGLAVVLVLGLVVFLVAKNRGDADAGSGTKTAASPTAAPTAPAARSTTTARPTTTTKPTTTTTRPTTRAVKPIKCGAVATQTVHGGSLRAIAPLLRGIHDAACHRDYAGLLRYMEDPFGDSTKKDVVAGWKRHDADGTVLQPLAQTLENPPMVDQGGYEFCSASGAVLIIGRGPMAHPGVWSDFDPTGHRLPVSCDGAT